MSAVAPLPLDFSLVQFARALQLALLENAAHERSACCHALQSCQGDKHQHVHHALETKLFIHDIHYVLLLLRLRQGSKHQRVHHAFETEAFH
jgi:hypothetical protein